MATGARRSVHPRIRGERINNVRNIECFNGSSPHTRGTPQEGEKHGRIQRFIPAYAGNAAGQLSVSKVCTVHPRIRGERARDRISGEREDGSSPHTRGTLKNLGGFEEAARFIPAYAGNAPVSSHVSANETVHPRIRGERSWRCSRAGRRAGSSPHTRGTRHRAQRGDFQRRFIPAYAGNATSSWASSCPSSVHPRIRGERWAKVRASSV